MDEKIKTTIEKIKLLAQQNSEFAKEMQTLFGKSETSVDFNASTKTFTNSASLFFSLTQIILA